MAARRPSYARSQPPVAPRFFLYEPLYSFYVDNPLDMGELGCFIGLAVIGAKCAADLLRPAVRVPQRVRG